MLSLKLGGEAIAIETLSLGSPPSEPWPERAFGDHFLIFKELR